MEGQLPSLDEAKRLLSYDPATGSFVWRVDRSRTAKSGNEAGWLDNRGYLRIMIRGRPYVAHRLAWLLANGVAPEVQIDHVNGIRTDNRIRNLRLATKAQNSQNGRLRSTNTSGFKGVHQRGTRFRANIWRGGKQVFLGSFSTPKEAHDAYCRAAKECFGEFARFA